jgi:hypothetical protein
MSQDSQPAVRRIRRVSGSPAVTQLPPQEGSYRGFGSVPGETLDEFHDRMYEIDPLEAMMYEMEVELGKCPISSIEIDQGMTHEEVDALESEELSIRVGMGQPLFNA